VINYTAISAHLTSLPSQASFVNVVYKICIDDLQRGKEGILVWDVGISYDHGSRTRLMQFQPKTIGCCETPIPHYVIMVVKIGQMF